MIVILGSGPSLDGFNFIRLLGREVVAINDAGLKLCPNASTLLSTDARWWMSVRTGERSLSAFKGACIVCTDFEFMTAGGISDRRLLYRARKRAMGLSPDPKTLHGVHTGVHAALNYAAHRIEAGESSGPIVLLGVDLKPDGARKYTYGGAVTPRTDGQFARMREALESCVKPLHKRGIAVVNGSPDSALTCWPRCSPEAALA